MARRSGLTTWLINGRPEKPVIPAQAGIQGFGRYLNLVLALLAAALFWSGLARAQDDGLWIVRAADGTPRVQLYFFWSEKCPHCLEARPHVDAFPAALPWLDLQSREITRHPEHVEQYVALARQLGQEANSVPAFLFCGEMHVGWETEATTGALLKERLTACHERSLAHQPLATPPQDKARLPLLGGLDADTLSLPVLTLVIAGMDAFNPCAFFVLLFLLSLMAHLNDRRRMLIVGGVFVAFSGIMYFAFMAAWLNLFQLIGGLPWVTRGAALLALVMGLVNVKDFFAFKRGPSLSIPESKKPDLYRRARAILAAGSLPAMLAATALLATAANFYELLCTAGFPMVYTRILTLRGLSGGEHYLYLALYNLVYILPLLAIVVAFARTLGGRKLSEREGRLLKLLSGVMMLQLGALLLLAPQALSQLGVVFFLLLSAVAITWALARRVRD